MAAFFGRRGDSPSEKRSPGAGSTGAVSFGGDRPEDTREQARAQRKTATVALAVVHDPENGDQFIPVKGRVAWMLARLLEAGDRGFTTVEAPGARVSDYVMKLRRSGISVEMQYEPHGGPYSGRHGRYFLRSKVTLRDPAELREVAA